MKQVRRYPRGISKPRMETKAQPMKSISHANRGKHLEKLIDMTNLQYRNSGRADVRKVPTPVNIKSINGKTVTGYLSAGEWVDYVGVGDGRALVFDAKETSVDRFPLNKLHEHQFELLRSWWEKGATAFLVVSFTKRHEEVYLLKFELLAEAWMGYIGDGPKSIPHKTFVEQCELITSRNGIVLDYLGALKPNG